MFKYFLDLLFPRYCLACRQTLNAGEQTICTLCRYNLPRTDSHLHLNEALSEKFYGRIPVASLNAYLVFTKGNKVQRLLHELKYNGQQEVGQQLGRWYGQELLHADFAEKIDLIIPVPMHAKKQKVRGYNQSDCFALGLAEALKVAWSAEILKKVKATESQTRMNRIERLQNVQDVFRVENAALIFNKRIALVDDVITTGVTLEECAETLLKAGCREVHILTIATAT